MLELELDELYARYLAGHALGTERRPRRTPPGNATLGDWALELGYVDGLAAAPIREEVDFARWCLCYRAYGRRSAAGAEDEAREDVVQDLPVVELCELLGSADARSGQWRSPLALIEVLRTFTNSPRPR